LHRHTVSTTGPILWRTPFPNPVRAALISHDNPGGTINNSELELLGSLWHHDVAAQCFDLRERTIRSHTDNLATLYWARRGSVTTTSPTAAILRHQAMHQRFHRYVPLKDYIPGPENQMADAASRMFHLNDPDLLTYFNQRFPQTQPWRLYRLHPSMRSIGISALRNKKFAMESWLQVPKPPLRIGRTGRLSATTYESILPYKTSKTPSPSSKSLPTASDTASSTPPSAPSAAAPWKVPYAALAKRSPVWGPRTHASPPKASSIFESNAC
jgi:hypothetical protein